MKTLEDIYIHVPASTGKLICETVHPALARYWNAAQVFRADVAALLFEMQEVKGNWDFKDEIFLKLVPEFNEHCKQSLERLSSLERTYLHSIEEDWQEGRGSFKDKLAVRRDLVQFLASKVETDFDSKPSEHFCHKALASFLKRMAHRFASALDAVLACAGQEIDTRACTWIRSEFAGWLGRHAPCIITPGNIDELLHDISFHDELHQVFHDLLIPSCGNLAWWLGLEPVVQVNGIDIRYLGDEEPGSRDFCILAWKSSFDKEGEIFHGGAAFDGVYQGDKQGLDAAFGKLGGADWLTSWLGSTPTLQAFGRLIHGRYKPGHPSRSISFLHAVLARQYGPATPPARDMIKAYIAGATYLADDERAALRAGEELIAPVEAGRLPWRVDVPVKDEKAPVVEQDAGKPASEGVK